MCSAGGKNHLILSVKFKQILRILDSYFASFGAALLLSFILALVADVLVVAERSGLTLVADVLVAERSGLTSRSRAALRSRR